MKRLGNPGIDVRLVKPRGPDVLESDHGGFVYASNDLSNTDALLLSNASVLNNSIVSGVDSSLYENGMVAHPSLIFHNDNRARMISSDGWTQEMDAKLRDAHDKFGNDWIKIAQYIDVGQSNKQCCRRWCQYLDPAISTRRTDEWTEDENNTLIDILKEYRIVNKTLKFTWSQVAKHIKTRTQVSCKKQYQQYIAPKTGPFSAAEDAALMQQASSATVGPRRPDIEFWVNLELVMQRPAESLCSRWSVLKAQETSGTVFSNLGSTSASAGGAGRGILDSNTESSSSDDDDDDDDDEFIASFGVSASSLARGGGGGGGGDVSGAASGKKKLPGDWSTSLDEELMAAYVTYNHDWNKISSHLTVRKSPKQCYQRWQRLVKQGSGAGGSQASGGWTEQQVNMLRDMATEHMGESTNAAGEPNGKIYWAVISKAVGHTYQDCRNKWRALKCPTFKKGFFTDEEDQIVINRVREWGNNGPGIWKVLEKELGRSEHSIYMGWNKRISKIAAKQIGLSTTVNTTGGVGAQQPTLTSNTSNSSALFQSQDLSEKGSAANHSVYTSAFLRGGRRGNTRGGGSGSGGKGKLFDDDSSYEGDEQEAATDDRHMRGHDLIPGVGGKGSSSSESGAATTVEAEMANVVSVLPRARPLKRSGSNNGGIWTPEMDAKLREAHDLFDKDFEMIADYMDNGQSARQCSLRWSLYVDPTLVTRRRGDWTPEEINQLKELTHAHLLRESQSFRVDWKTVAALLNREQNDCKFKFKELFHSDLKTGPYTPEEDALILARVRETGDGGVKFRPGFWAQVGKELNRSSSTVIFRWKKTLCKIYDSAAL